jgi:hypothetical protein
LEITCIIVEIGVKINQLFKGGGAGVNLNYFEKLRNYNIITAPGMTTFHGF